MDILVIGKLYLPCSIAESLATAKFVAALLADGQSCQVIAGHQPGPTDDSSLWDDRTRSCTRIAGALGGLSERIRDRLPAGSAQYAWDDVDAWAWARHATRAAAGVIAREACDVVVTRSVPFPSAFAGHDLARRTRRPWVACVSDPLQSPLPAYAVPCQPLATLQKAPTAWRLRRMLPAADLVVFPCRRLADYVQEQHRIDLGDRARVIPHIGWAAPSVPVQAPGKVRIAHLGHIRRRGCLELLEGFRAALASREFSGLDVELQFVGHPWPDLLATIEATGTAGVTRVVPSVPYEKSLQLMQEATALMLVEAKLEEGIFLPSKFADYAVGGRPLLMFCPPVGTISDVVGGYDHPGFMGQSREGAEAVFTRFLRDVAAARDLAAYTVDPTPYLPRTVAREFVSAMGPLAEARIGG